MYLIWIYMLLFSSKKVNKVGCVSVGHYIEEIKSTV